MNRKKLFYSLIILVFIYLYLLFCILFFNKSDSQKISNNKASINQPSRKEIITDKIITLKEKVEKETGTEIIFVDSENGFSEILNDKISADIYPSIEKIYEDLNKNSGVFVNRPIVFDNSGYDKTFIVFDRKELTSSTVDIIDCIFAHEIGHIAVESEDGNVVLVAISDKDTPAIRDIMNSLENWRADLFAIQNGFNCENIFDKKLTRELNLLKSQDERYFFLDKPFFYVDIYLRDKFYNEKTRKEFLSVYSEKFTNKDELSKVTKIAEEIQASKNNYNTDIRQGFIKELVEIKFPEKKFNDIAYLYTRK